MVLGLLQIRTSRNKLKDNQVGLSFNLLVRIKAKGLIEGVEVKQSLFNIGPEFILVLSFCVREVLILWC